MRPLLAALFTSALLGCGDKVLLLRDATEPTLELFPGHINPVGGMTPGSMRVPVGLIDRSGATVMYPAGLTFVSRSPDIVRVDSATYITTVKPQGGTTWLVASLAFEGRVLYDSLNFAVIIPGRLSSPP
jgi:hypothetical protein